MYKDGSEIADHTVSHTTLPGMEASKLRYEIAEARKRLAACGIPEVRAVACFAEPASGVPPCIVP